MLNYISINLRHYSDQITDTVHYFFVSKLVKIVNFCDLFR